MLIAVESGAVALDYFMARHLERRGHHRLAEAWLVVDVAGVAPWAIHNLYLINLTTKTQPTRLPRLPHVEVTR